MRKLLIGLIVVVALMVVFMRGDSFVELVETMKTGALVPLIVAIITQLGKYVAQSFAFSKAFSTVGEVIRPRHTINLVFGMFFMNTVAPSVGASGIVLVVDDARRRGVPTGRATSAALLMQISIEFGFLTIMTIGFIIMGITGTFQWFYMIFYLIVVALVGAESMLLVLGYAKPNMILRVCLWAERMVNKVLAKFKKGPMDPWADQLVNSFGEAAHRIARNPREAVKTFLFSIVASMCELACFILCGAAFGVSLLPALIGGYVVATLFAMVSVTPQGVGFVEAAILVLMTSYGVSAAAATAVGVVYRGLVFWMPFIIGAILINRTKTFSRRKDKTAAPSASTSAQGDQVESNAAGEQPAAVAVAEAVATVPPAAAVSAVLQAADGAPQAAVPTATTAPQAVDAPAPVVPVAAGEVQPAAEPPVAEPAAGQPQPVAVAQQVVETAPQTTAAGVAQQAVNVEPQAADNALQAAATTDVASQTPAAAVVTEVVPQVANVEPQTIAADAATQASDKTSQAAAPVAAIDTTQTAATAPAPGDESDNR